MADKDVPHFKDPDSNEDGEGLGEINMFQVIRIEKGKKIGGGEGVKKTDRYKNSHWKGGERGEIKKLKK